MRRIESLDDPEFVALVEGFAVSAFRLETFQDYTVDYEEPALAAYLAGRPLPPDPDAEPWTAMIRAHVDAGRTMRRVHVVAEPLTPYMRFELEHGYAAGVAGGEEIRIVVARTAEAYDLPAEDFWLFDDETAVVMTYGIGGEFLEAVLIREPEIVASRVRWSRDAWDAGIPLADYCARAGLGGRESA